MPGTVREVRRTGGAGSSRMPRGVEAATGRWWRRLRGICALAREFHDATESTELLFDSILFDHEAEVRLASPQDRLVVLCARGLGRAKKDEK